MVLNMEIHETLVKASFGEGTMDGSEQSPKKTVMTCLGMLHNFHSGVVTFVFSQTTAC